MCGVSNLYSREQLQLLHLFPLIQSYCQAPACSLLIPYVLQSHMRGVRILSTFVQYIHFTQLVNGWFVQSNIILNFLYLT